MNSAGVSMIFFVRDSERLDIFIMKFPISLFRAARLFTTVITGTARLMSGWARSSLVLHVPRWQAGAFVE